MSELSSLGRGHRAIVRTLRSLPDGETVPELAKMLGCTHSRLYRVLPWLAQEGWLVKDGRRWKAAQHGEPPRQSNRLPRATCPVCRGDVAMRRGGLLRQHPDHRHEMYSVPGAVRDGLVPWCPGSGNLVMLEALL